MNAPNVIPFMVESERCRSAQREWARQSIRERLRPVRRFRESLVGRARELALRVTQDVGRPFEEVLSTDVLPVADACAFLERRAARLLKARPVPAADRPLWLIGSREVVERRPRGVIGVIGTWNYPIFLNAVTIVQALTAGNGVLWKPSELTPMTAQALVDAFHEAGFPRDLLQLLPASREAGPQLAESTVDHIVFTGSADVGRKLARRLGERLIPSTLELSGCDAMIVMEDADITMAAKAAWFGAMLNKGQTCLAVRRVFVARNRYSEFVAALRPLAEAARPEPLALDAQATQAERLIRDAIAQGGQLLGPGTLPVAGADPARFPPTIIIDATPEMAICREASFSPVQAIIPFDHAGELMNWHRRCSYGLGASIFTRDRAAAEQLARELAVGYVCINDVIVQTAHPATPFGGVGDSGWGVTQGAEGLLELTVPQVIAYRKGTFRPHYDVNNPELANIMEGMLRWKHAPRLGQRLRGLWQMIRAMIRSPR